MQRARVDRARLVLARLRRRPAQIGTGVIFGEPQPWALLAGVPSAAAGAHAGGQHPPLPHRGRRAGGDRTGRRGSAPSQSPARGRPGRHRARAARPGLRRRQRGLRGRRLVRDQRLADLGARRARRRRAARAARTRSTSSSATRSPRTPPPSREHWNGVISVDDACNAYYAADPARCGIGLDQHLDARADHAPAGLEPVRGASTSPASSPRRAATASTRTCR